MRKSLIREGPHQNIQKLLDNCFVIADNAQLCKDHRMTSLMFAYIFENQKFRPHLRFEIEVFETIPVKYKENDDIARCYFHQQQSYNSLGMRFGNHYLRIPAPAVSVNTFNRFLDIVDEIRKKEEHVRPFVDVYKAAERGFKVIHPGNINQYLPDITEPLNFFFVPLGYKNYTRNEMKTHRKSKRVKSILEYFTPEELGTPITNN